MRRMSLVGFRCPVCSDDFGRDKMKWREHIEQAHDGLGNDIIKTLENIVKDPSEEAEEE